MPERKIWT